MENFKAFDLDVDLKVKAAGDVQPQTTGWVCTAGKTIVNASKAACKTFTCICSGSCWNCD